MLITTYHTPSSTKAHEGTLTICIRKSKYGIKKYLGSSNGVGKSVTRVNVGSAIVWSMLCSFPDRWEIKFDTQRTLEIDVPTRRNHAHAQTK